MLMHHFIVAKPLQGFVVDHINGDGLDNSRENLRFATLQQNSQNKPKKQGCSSTYIGVWYIPNRRTWRVGCGGMHIGEFSDQLEAAKAYDGAALYTYAPGAKTNRLNSVPIPPPAKRELPKGVRLRFGRYQWQVRQTRMRFSFAM